MQEVVVINRHPFKHTDKHLGIEYVFAPGEKVTIPLAAAVHFFGLGLNDRGPAMKRYGKTNRDEGEKFLNNFTLTTIDYVPKDEADKIDELKITLEAHGKEIKDRDEKIERLEIENENLRKKVKELESKFSIKKETNGK